MGYVKCVYLDNQNRYRHGTSTHSLLGLFWDYNMTKTKTNSA